MNDLIVGRSGGHIKWRIISSLIAMPIVYVTVYLVRGQRICAFENKEDGQVSCGSSFRYAWEAKIFMPAAAIESYVMNTNRVIGTKDELIWQSPNREERLGRSKPDSL